MGKPMQRIYDVAVEMGKKHTAHDFKHRSAVAVRHDDGTDYWFKNAFAIIYYDKDHGDEGMTMYPGEWLMVFTEHHGIHVFHFDELENWAAWERSSIGKHPDYPDYQWVCETCGGKMIEPAQYEEGPGCSRCGLPDDGEHFKIRKIEN